MQAARTSHAEKVSKLVKRRGIIRPRDLDALKIPRATVRRMEQKGQLVRLSRGIYIHPDAELSEYYSLAEASKKVPHGVICLLSALRFHGMTTQSPFEVWMAIDRKARLPKTQEISLKIVRFSNNALTSGIETHKIDGVEVRIYNPAKTVADCFKYRNKIGLDVAIEALKDCREQRKCSQDQLWHYSKICRVSNVMRPYLEVMS